MNRRLSLFAAVGILLAALVLTGCNPSTGKAAEGSPESIVRAMAQAISVDATNSAVSATGENTYKVTNFKADDGSSITGTFETNTSGKVLAAELTLTYSDGSPGPVFVMKTDNSGTDITLDNRPVNPSSLPRTMTRAEHFAFRAFIEGFDEAFDEVKDILEDSLEIYENRKPGTHTIDNEFMKGTITVEMERGDDDLEIVAANITSFTVPFRTIKVSGSYSFSEHRDTERAEVKIRIQNFRDDEVVMNDITIDAVIEEGEIRDDDYFLFDGSISGSYSIGSTTHTIDFSGTINAEDDDFIRFPEYTLRIDGNNVAIGRQNRR